MLYSMTESNEIKSLGNISSEVTDSHVKIIFTNQCIKAQLFLTSRLKKEIQRQKEICKFQNKENLRLETSIKNTEQEIKSMRISYDIIKSANVDLEKELLLAKDRKQETIERIEAGEKKYEDLWLQCKMRYESIPFVQKRLQAEDRAQTLTDKIISLEKETKLLMNEIKAKKKFLLDLDRKRIVELSQFFVNEMPISMKAVKEKSAMIVELMKAVEEISKEAENPKLCKPLLQQSQKIKNTVTDDDWPILPKNISSKILTMPKLQLTNNDHDLELLTNKLHQVKNLVNKSPVEEDSVKSSVGNLIPKADTNIENIYFNKPVMTVNEASNDDCGTSNANYNKRKLIHILKDINLDKYDAYNIVSKVKPDKLRKVDKIGGNEDDDVSNSKVSKQKEIVPIRNEQIEEIDLTINSGNILMPPVQFLDLSQDKSQPSSHQVEIVVHMSINGSPPTDQKESTNKKKVSFGSPILKEEMKYDTIIEKSEDKNENFTNETTNYELNVSTVSEESYTQLKEKELKKHNLDSSPTFVYAKNTILSMRADENITSKFFKQSNKLYSEPDKMLDSNMDNKGVQSKPIEYTLNDKDQTETVDMKMPTNDNFMDVEERADTSPKDNQVQGIDNPVSGYLFKHGPSGISESLNISVTTTDFDEGDLECPRYIDSSLLLSPKADLPMPSSNNNSEISSLNVPNFLSGLRKTGLSIFGRETETLSKPDSSKSQQQGNNFNFNFGGEEKNRGGLFSMFR